MRKYSLLLVLLFQVLLGFGQNPEIKTDLPTVIPPSPTVSALMKFEEVPVSNYTGVPDVSIPLFSSPTLFKDINLDISLKYHSGVGANDRASDVGLGWSLFAGGTVSRTVRGLPDEQLVLDGGSSPGKVGLYHTTLNNHNNYYYQYGANMSQFVYNEPFKANEYIWDIVERGKFDTEHDLWQFNFMGFSGRFYIEKDLITNQLKIVPLDDYRVKIINNYNTFTVNGVQNPYIPTGFTIYDEKGNRYEFDVVETTTNSTAVSNVFASSNTSSLSAEKVFNSAFQLSKIYDVNNNLLIEFIFNSDATLKECTTNKTYTFNDYSASIAGTTDPTNTLMNQYNCFGEFKPIKSFVNSLSVVAVKKIQSINVTGFSKIDLNYVKGQRLDTNIDQIANASSLNSITIKDWNNTIVKKYNLYYNYSTVIDTRMLLQRIEEVGGTSTISNYQFFYETNTNSGYNIGKDYWGYFNLIPSCIDKDNAFENEPSPTFSSTDVLQKIKYPTGGCTVFNFEANQYSYIGDVAVSNFDENPNNFSLTTTNTLTFSNTTTNNNTGTTNAGIQLLNYSSTENKKVKIYSSIAYPQDITLAIKALKIMKLVGTNWVQVANLTCSFGRTGCCTDFILQQGIQYGIKREFFIPSYSGTNDNVTVEYFTKNVVEKKYLYGGGNRIKQIGYFDVDVPENYYKNSPNGIFPKKEKLYSYILPTDFNKSSGSLVFAKPLFKYENAIKINTSCAGEQGGITYIGVINFVTNNNFNSLISLRTQGADVGYKYVTVKESGNGRVNYEYTSPIDYPEELLFTNTPPFLPTRNLDFKRGLLLKEIVENESFTKLKEVNYLYDFVQTDRTYGIRRYKPSGICFGGQYFTTYSSYLPYYESQQVICPSLGTCFGPLTFCGYPSNYTQQYPLIETYGWAKLINKTTKEFLFDSTNTLKTVQTDETFTYNPINKKIDEQTVTNSFGEVMKTKYYYLTTVDNTYSKNNISTIEKIETYKGAELLTTSKINYATTFVGNTSYLPQTISTSKGSNYLETKVRYNAYDIYGNPLELRQEDGTIISYIWGYNKSQPIAKIENATNAQIKTALGVSDLNLVNETNLTAIDALRSNATLANSLITTYTYIPLVGVSTITDPKGDKTTFIYDEFNRLKEVRDKNNNILSENQYNYKN